MRKTIWVMGTKRQDMITAQRQINALGSMRAVCLLSFAALERAVESLPDKPPSLLILDYEMSKEEDFRSLDYWNQQPVLAGVPIFFMADKRNEELDEECYLKGATVVVHKPFTRSNILRIERSAWQYEVTRDYEKTLQRQASDLQAAKEIMHLNKQLNSRNQLLHQLFGRYFSEKVLEVILEQPEGAAIGGEKRELTIMMADLRGFTSLSADLETEEVTRLLNVFFENMVGVINKYRGTVIEFLGDAVLAVFGAPIITENHTEDAIAAAIMMQNRMIKVNAECQQNGYSRLEMGIGIHRGEAFIGNIGSEKMMRYNVIGQVVNECSRIESYSIGGQILLSKEALDAVSCPVIIDEQFDIKAKGLQGSMSVNVVAGIGGEYSINLLQEEPEKMNIIPEGIWFELHPMDKKKIMEQFVRVIPVLCSYKQAVVRRLYGDESPLELLMDAELRALDKKGNLIFEGVYAKLTKWDKGEITLSFTHINQEFSEFIKKLECIDRESEETMEKEQDEYTAIEDKHIMEGMCAGFRNDKRHIVVAEVTKQIAAELEQWVEEEDYQASLPVCGDWLNALSCRYLLLVGKAEKGEEQQVFFISDSKAVRALEILDCLLPEFALVKGNWRVACGKISAAILKVEMADREAESILDYYRKMVSEYFQNTNVVEAKEYGESHREEIMLLPRYLKKQISWAYVKTTDVVNKGTKIVVRPLENSSGIEVVSQEDTYIMIGCRGEVYVIKRDTFEKTYQATDEPLDVFSSMMEFFAEVQVLDTGEYITIDEQAHLCYPKQGSGIYVMPLTSRTKVFPSGGDGNYFLGRPGDYMAVKADDITDIYIIRRDIFEDTYEPAQP